MMGSFFLSFIIIIIIQDVILWVMLNKNVISTYA
jgi:hypothetical protein